MDVGVWWMDGLSTLPASDRQEDCTAESYPTCASANPWGIIGTFGIQVGPELVSEAFVVISESTREMDAQIYG